MWETRAEEGLFSIYCLDCGSKLIGDAERGEQVCPSCGSVTNAREDEGPEWKAVDLEEKNKRVASARRPRLRYTTSASPRT